MTMERLTPMPNRQIHVTIQEDLPSPLPEELLRRAALAALDVAHPNRDCQLTIALCDDHTIRSLNSQYRGDDKITDVLAFSPTHSGPWQGDDDSQPSPDEPHAPFPSPPNQPPDLGDVIISLPQAQRQAAEARHSLERETALLVIHGVLHLLGHDHQLPDEKSLMWSLQSQALATLPIPACHSEEAPRRRISPQHPP